MITVLFVFSLSILNAQNADCNTSLYFQDSIGVMPTPKGYGKKLEIKGNNIKNEYLFTKEHNTSWSVIHFSMDASFQFELVPQFVDDDFDFVIFKYSGASTCDSIEKNLILPVRSNLSKRTPEKGSVTGLKKGFENNFSAAGPNPSFSKPLEVKAGDSILLIIDSPYGSKGSFSVFNFTEYYPTIKEEVAETLEIEESPRNLRVTIISLDENGNNIIAPNIYLKSLGKEHRDDPQYDAEGNIYSEFFNPGVEQVIIASQKGYLFQKYNFKWDGAKDTTIIIHLTPLTLGTKLQLENILFLPNSPQFLSSSKDELSNLVLFLKSNPSMEVEIGGHVHGTTNRNRKKYRKLSEERAIAVYNYAVSNGIDASRLKYKGYGNSQMIFKPAKNETEIKANRRVEFTITKVN